MRRYIVGSEHVGAFRLGRILVIVCCGALAAGFLNSPALPAAEADTPLAEAEQTLKDNKVATDGASLLRYFRHRTLSKAERDKLGGYISQLGDEDFEVRRKAFAQLLKGGQASLVFLKRALTSSDVEIRRSAQKLINRIEGGSEAAVTVAAAFVLGERKPEGAVKVLLAYLPLAQDDLMQEAIFTALGKAGVKDGKADSLLVKALADKETVRRRAAIAALAKAGPEQRKAIVPLLKDDNAHVRFQAAKALLWHSDKAAASVLIALVGKGPAQVAELAEGLLFTVAGDNPPAEAGITDQASRAGSQKAWEKWWKDNAAKIDLAKVRKQKALRGITVIVEHDNSGKDNRGRIWATRKGGKVIWELDNGLGGPMQVQPLPNGRFLIAEYMTSRVTERDRKGKVVWEKAAGNSTMSAQRLANGNTFIATRSTIMEVDRKGKVLYNWLKGDVYRAHKLPNKHVVYTTSQQVIELDANGKQLVAIPLNGLSWGDAVKLPNGRYLVSAYSAGKVMEVDKKGKVFWEVNIAVPTAAQRLPNGNTLVASGSNMVVEFNRKGKEVWKKQTRGRVWNVFRH
jgi:HEAT repeat protein